MSNIFNDGNVNSSITTKSFDINIYVTQNGSFEKIDELTSDYIERILRYEDCKDNRFFNIKVDAIKYDDDEIKSFEIICKNLYCYNFLTNKYEFDSEKAQVYEYNMSAKDKHLDIDVHNAYKINCMSHAIELFADIIPFLLKELNIKLPSYIETNTKMSDGWVSTYEKHEDKIAESWNDINKHWIMGELHTSYSFYEQNGIGDSVHFEPHFKKAVDDCQFELHQLPSYDFGQHIMQQAYYYSDDSKYNHYSHLNEKGNYVYFFINVLEDFKSFKYGYIHMSIRGNLYNMLNESMIKGIWFDFLSKDYKRGDYFADSIVK